MLRKKKDDSLTSLDLHDLLVWSMHYTICRMHKMLHRPQQSKAWIWAPSCLSVGRCMVIVWKLRGNIIRTAPCCVVWHNVHSQQHTHVSSSYRSSRLGLSHWDPYTMRRGGCLELYYCNMVEWCWWDSSLPEIPTGFLQCFDTVGLVIWPVKIVADMTYNEL